MAFKYIKWQQYIPNGLQIYQMAAKYTKCQLNIPTSAIARPFRIYPNRDFWFGNIASGNPGRRPP
jgi:hypothetical protein